MRVAVIHDWLTTIGGAERVLAEILDLYLGADVFALVDFLSEEQRVFLRGRPVGTSFIQKLPFAKTHYRNYLPLMPLAVEQFDVSGYDLVISSTYAVVKGIITGPDQVHVSYCHSPMRYAWDLSHQYLSAAKANRLKDTMMRLILYRMRIWDIRTGNGVDRFVANSHFVARRINKVYRREADVIYPPVDLSRLEARTQKDDYYVTVSRLVPYKKVDLLVEAFSQTPQRQLYVIGSGPEFKAIKAKAGANVHMLGYETDDTVRRFLQGARAFVFAGEEDFGIAPVEAQACGTPVILYGKGGAVETIRGLESERPTGMFFQEQSPESLLDALDEFERTAEAWISPWDCRANAERFSSERFREQFAQVVDRELAQRRGTPEKVIGDARLGTFADAVSRSETYSTVQRHAHGGHAVLHRQEPFQGHR